MREFTRMEDAEIEKLRGMTPDDRLQLAAKLRRMHLSVMRQGFRDRFPDLGEDAMDEKIGGLLHGREFWREVCRLRRNA